LNWGHERCPQLDTGGTSIYKQIFAMNKPSNLWETSTCSFSPAKALIRAMRQNGWELPGIAFSSGLINDMIP
jgi:hypothetical protein